MVAVALSGSGIQKIICRFFGSRQNRHHPCINDTGKLSAHHLVQMAQKAETGHIGCRVDRILSADLGSVFVQRCHGRNGTGHIFRCRFAHTVCRADQAHAQSFC